VQQVGYSQPGEMGIIIVSENKIREDGAVETGVRENENGGSPAMTDPIIDGAINSAAPAQSGEKVAVVIGGLTLVRCLGMDKIPFVAVTATGDPRDHFVRYSRYCREGLVTADPKQNPEKVLADLIAIGKRQKARSPLYYGKDQDQRLVSENREELGKYFDFLMPDAETIDICLDKAKFSAYCRAHDLPIPETFSEEETVERLRNKTPWVFPLALKPSSHVTWFESPIIRALKGVQYKALILNTIEELEKLVEAMQAEKIPFLVQRYVAGGDDRIFSFHTFLDRDSNPLGYFVGRKIRTFPPTTGESTYLQLARNDALVELALRLLKRIRFVGPVKMDFKQDANDGQFYLLEINARYNLWHYLGASSGINLPAYAFRYFSGQPLPSIPRTYRTDIKWLHFRYDLRAFLAYRKKGELTLRQWLVSLMSPKVYAKFAWNDLLPSVAALVGFFKARLENLTGRP
jgi:D-aspartate ligase